MNKNLYIGGAAALLIVIVILGYGYYRVHRIPAVMGPAPTTSVSYACVKGTISAAYAEQQVALTLSDGRMFILPQVVSGSGVRYEQGAGTGQDYVFWSKGDNAFFTENGKTTYDNCVANKTPDTSDAAGMKTFTDSGKTFQFAYPSDLTVSGGGVGYSMEWSMLGAQQALGMVLAKVTIPRTFQPKTNFSDATFTVGTSADPQAVKDCLVAPQGNPTTMDIVVMHGVSFRKFTTGDAGAGNFYETTSYRTLRNSQCYSVEYTIHSTNIGNYSPDQGITAFDQAKVQGVLEGMVQSFLFL